MDPIYTPDNTNVAYQLNWSLALFGKQSLPRSTNWLENLKVAIEPDGVRILSCSLTQANVIQFFVSSRPALSPSQIVRSIKGRLQYEIRDDLPKAFRRNYHIQSVGEASSAVLDHYIAGQPAKHPMADQNVQDFFEANQFLDSKVNLSKPTTGTYGQFLNSLQLVFRNCEGWNEIRRDQLLGVRNIVVAAAKKKRWKLSRIGLLANHLHVLLGVAVTESPETVALSCMNNIAYVYKMKPILKFSYYAGTFGGYDRGAIRNNQRVDKPERN